MDEHVRQIFERISVRYDLANDLISFFQHGRWRRQAMRMLPVQKGAKVLDLCCGTGDWTILSASMVGPRGEVHGIDFSEKMLAGAQRKARKRGLTNITLHRGNVTERLPFGDNYFDYCTVGFGLRNVSDYKKVLLEVRRVLQPGGRLLCLDTSKTSLPLVKQLFYLHLRFMVPLLGWLLMGSYEEYLWLYKSTVVFPDKARLAGDFQRAGFQDVCYAAYWGGTVAVHAGTKG